MAHALIPLLCGRPNSTALLIGSGSFGFNSSNSNASSLKPDKCAAHTRSLPAQIVLEPGTLDKSRLGGGQRTATPVPRPAPRAAPLTHATQPVTSSPKLSSHTETRLEAQRALAGDWSSKTDGPFTDPKNSEYKEEDRDVIINYPESTICVPTAPERKHQCKECEKSFNSGKALGGHMSSAHFCLLQRRRSSGRRSPLTGRPTPYASLFWISHRVCDCLLAVDCGGMVRLEVAGRDVGFTGDSLEGRSAVGGSAVKLSVAWGFELLGLAAPSRFSGVGSGFESSRLG
ncbi:C2H2-like zinc finger protein [Striga asiatica]|uniref:C2H2-like zinc finger protein n=1 Tax=Striga asiatica TaxID=4170 RepID=A0A5A7RBT8_STRAF|nr:C2H2-like zinc finger protein [Striga asiatica]